MSLTYISPLCLELLCISLAAVRDVKGAAYKSLVQPILEAGSTVWDPHCNGLNDDLENLQSVQLVL